MERENTPAHSSNKPSFLVHICVERRLTILAQSIFFPLFHHWIKPYQCPRHFVPISKWNVHGFDQSQSFDCQIIETPAWLVDFVFAPADNHSACARLISANMSVEYWGCVCLYFLWECTTDVWLVTKFLPQCSVGKTHYHSTGGTGKCMSGTFISHTPCGTSVRLLPVPAQQLSCAMLLDPSGAK